MLETKYVGDKFKVLVVVFVGMRERRFRSVTVSETVTVTDCNHELKDVKLRFGIARKRFDRYFWHYKFLRLTSRNTIFMRIVNWVKSF